MPADNLVELPEDSQALKAMVCALLREHNQRGLQQRRADHRRRKCGGHHDRAWRAGNGLFVRRLCVQCCKAWVQQAESYGDWDERFHGRSFLG